MENKERKKMRGAAVMMADVALILLGITSRYYLFAATQNIHLLNSFPFIFFHTAGALVFLAVKGESSGYYLVWFPNALADGNPV